MTIGGDSRWADRPLPEWAARRKPPRDPETGFLYPRRCELYFAGHSIHWIQANRSAGQPFLGGRLADVEGNVVTVEVGGQLCQYRNHAPERLVEICGIGGALEICDEWFILRTPRPTGNFCFSVVRAEKPWIPCDDTPLRSASPDDLAERVRTHGGYVVAGREVLKHLDEASGSEGHLVYGILDGNLILLPEDVARAIDLDLGEIQACTTYGQARALQPRFLDVPGVDLEPYEEFDEEIPADEAPYVIEETFELRREDGWRARAATVALDCLPEELDDIGEQVENFPFAPTLFIDPATEFDLVRTLEERDFTVRRDDDLMARID